MKIFNFLSKIIYSKPLLSALLIHVIIITLLCAFTVFKGNGHAVFVDITEGIRLEDSVNRVYSTYDDNWGEAIAEKQRIYPFTIIWGLFKITPFFDVSDFVPFRMLISYYFSIFGFILALKLVASKAASSGRKKGIFLAVLASTFVYLYNPWMTNRIMHIFLYLSSFTVPVFFGLLYKYFFNSKHEIIYPVLIGILLGTFTTTPHTLLLVAIVGVILVGFALFKRLFKETLILLGISIPIFLLTGMFWILPYVMYRPIPDRVESMSIVELLARNATIFNNIKLQGYWWNYLLPKYEFFSNTYIRFVNSLVYLIPFGLLLALLKRIKERKVQIITVLFLISIFLASYNSITSLMYSNIMFGKLSSFGWIFREIEKLSFLTAFAYSLGVFMLISKVKKLRSGLIISVFFIPLIAVYFFYFNSYINRNMTKVEIPEDYYKLNELLSADNSEYNVTFYPQVQRVSWANRVDGTNLIANLSSLKPTVPNVAEDSSTIYYINYVLDEKNIPLVDVGKSLDLIGTKYLVIRNDLRGNSFDKTIELLKSQPTLELMSEMPYLTVFRNLEYKGLLEVKHKRIVTNMGLNSLEYLTFAGIDFNNYVIDYTDLSSDDIELNTLTTSYLLDSEGYLDLAMNALSDDFVYPADSLIITDPNQGWAKTSLTDKTHAESELYFNNYGISSRQFNYGREAALSLGGLQWSTQDSDLHKKIIKNLSFQPKEWYLISGNEGVFTIVQNGSETDSIWNIIESDLIEVKASVIGINGNVATVDSEILDPHFKVRYYDENKNYLGVHFIHPTNRREISSVVELPKEAKIIDFSAWSLGGKHHIPLIVKDLSLYELDDKYYSSPSLSVSVNSTCHENCVLMARILKNPNYPSDMKFTWQDSEKLVRNTSLGSKYKWVKVGEVNSTSEPIEINITNLGGINSIAALVIVNDSELSNELTKQVDLISNYDHTFSFGDVGFFSAEDIGIRAKVQLTDYVKNLSTKYTVRVKDLSEPGVMLFKNPYKKAWNIEGVDFLMDAEVYDLVSTGWVVKNIGDYTITYSPQKLFTLGLKVSICSISVIALGLIVYGVKKKFFKSPRS